MKVIIVQGMACLGKRKVYMQPINIDEYKKCWNTRSKILI